MAGPVRIVVPLPLALRSANAWLFPGSPPALVDSAIGTVDGYAALRQGLWDSGFDANGLRLFVTHGHIDHAGNAARLRREFGALLHAPPEESALVETFRADAGRRYAAYTEALRSHGVPDAEVTKMRERGEGMDPWMEDVPIQSPLRDGQRVQLGDTAATVHLAPGHTPGSALYATADNDLVTGDTLLEHITSNAIEVTDGDKGRYAQYLRTLDGLRRFAGMRALPGHHEPFQVTEALIDGHLAKHAERSQRILARLDRPRTAWSLVPDVFPRLVHDQAFLGVCEVVGHLHALEEQGKAAMQEEDGVRRFTRT
ncbi:MAG: MBL fold metallo-hydrolase [Thermoplasmatota archaeon]